MKTWEQREKRNANKALILSIAIHIGMIAALAIWSGKDGGHVFEEIINKVFNGRDAQETKATSLAFDTSDILLA